MADTPTSKRTRTASEETSSGNNLIDETSIGVIKALIAEMGKEITDSIKKDLNANNKILTESLVNNISQLKESMNKINKRIEEEISAINTNYSTVSTNVAAIKNDLQSTKSKVETFETTTQIALNNVTKCQKYLENKMRQNRLENVMEIKGISPNDYSTHANMKELAIQIMKSFSINITAVDLTKAIAFDLFQSKQPNSPKTKILQVTFKDFDKKIDVLKCKNQIQDARGIYFNAALTPLNRRLISEARKMCKNKNIKLRLKDGTWNAFLKDKKFLLRDEDDLVELRIYLESIASSSQSNFA